MKKLVIVTFIILTGCTTLIFDYGDDMVILNGKYKGYTGTLISDCPGFENYRLYIPRLKKKICVKSWNMERI